MSSLPKAAVTRILQDISGKKTIEPDEELLARIKGLDEPKAIISSDLLPSESLVFRRSFLPVSAPVAVQPEFVFHNGFSVDSSNVYIQDRRTQEPVQLINFTVRLKSRVISLDDGVERLEVEVTCEGVSKSYVMDTQKYRDLAEMVFKDFPSAYRASVADANVRIAEYLAKEYTRQIASVPVLKRSNSFGWAKCDETLVFCHGGDGMTNTRKTLPSLAGLDAPRVFKEGFETILALSSDQGVAVPLLLWVHLGILRRLFVEADFPVKNLLYIGGRTGSLKTSTAVELFNVFLPKNNRAISADHSTRAGIEAHAKSCKDDFLLLDDYYPATVSSVRNELEQLLERLCRMVGDATARAVVDVTKGTACKSTTFETVAVVTGEVLGGSTSSKLRILYLEFSNTTINKEILTLLAEQGNIVPEYLALLAQYVEKNQAGIIKFIRGNFASIRRHQAQYFEFERSAELSAMLHCVLHVVLSFAVDYGYYPSCEQTPQQAMSNAIKVAITRNESVVAEETPVTLYLMALNQALGTGVIHLASNETEFFESPSAFVGFKKQKGQELWLNHQAAGQVVANVLRKENKAIAVPLRQVYEDLVKQGVVIGTAGKSPRPYRRSSKGEPRIDMLCVKAGVLEEKIEKILRKEEF